MAKPRVFISSTFYDLRQIRVELDRFVESLGYEPVRNEEGDIPYGKDESLQNYCYKEIENVDILISIIGGRYGSSSNAKDRECSISQLELKTALKEDKQVFIFVDKNVLTEYETYLLNKSQTDIKYKYVDSINIYKFIEEIKGLPNNNNIKEFETADNITRYLKEQFAGLFKQFIIERRRIKESLIIKDIGETAKTLKELVDYLKVDNEDKDGEFNRILRINHPLVSSLKTYLEIPYNFYIEGKEDMENLLSARGFKSSNTNEFPFDDFVYEKVLQNGIGIMKLTISNSLFENEKLKYIKPNDWNENLVQMEQVANTILNDDLPF